MQGLDLRALEIFRTVAMEGSVSKAAVKLNRVQSNISTRVKQLEEQLQKQLFVRRNRGLTLTPDGEMLLPYADRMLQLSQEASEALSEGRPSGEFRIGAMESTAAARLPDILSRFHDRHPDVRVELQTDTAGGLLECLLNREIEVAFVAEPVAFERIHTLPVFEERLILVAPKSFPPLENTDQISGKTVIAFEAGCAYRRYLEDWLLDAGIVPGNVMAVSSYLAILACVAAGTGYAVVPQTVLDIVAAKGQFLRHPLPGKLSRIKTLLAWRVDYRSAKLDALRELLPRFGGD
ncbi:MAG: LysR substrate-binding domain-containing protein [Alphaproteobacteria bacterium]|jgi:DNA-binding transcriptional LysR family regulator|nr:LysR substrate-binding domain-containing protein [Alphaproteobacteria bacterium]MDP6566988.1 LysR substrate-binding domain-containing protein [Alphaproteobacteria bacterium]MDP6812167.1 LysR substrate-binding domain-containing protein [Alphaproteobacteria bacterium]